MKQFETNIINNYGLKGQEWLANIPTLQNELAEKYSLTNLRPVDNMSYNYVAMGQQYNKPIILKLGMNEPALRREAECLKLFSKVGAAELLACGNGMLLMKQAIPGNTLKDYFPDAETEAMDIVCEVLNNIHSIDLASEHDFYSLDDLFAAFETEHDIPEQLLAHAKIIRNILLATTEKSVLLHGDLHHENILKESKAWLIIDPKGFVGDPIYDLVAFIRNPIVELLTSSEVEQIICHRINYFSEQLGYSSTRILEWCFVQSVLAWIWILEDGGAEENFQRLTRLFFNLLTA